MTEEWRDYPYDARYQLSSLGRVRGPRGLLTISKKLFARISGANIWLPRLLNTVFNGPPPHEDYETDYKDGERGNLAAANLFWTKRASRNYVSGELNGKSKLSFKDIQKIKKLAASGVKAKEIHKEFGQVKLRQIYFIMEGVSWK